MVSDPLGAYPQSSAQRWRVGGEEIGFVSAIGVRGHPGIDPALIALGDAIDRGRLAPPGPHALDASGGSGAVAALVQRQHASAGRLLVQSASVRRAALAGGLSDAELLSAHPWDLEASSLEEVWWRPASDRGWARVLTELDAWSRALLPAGRLVCVWHKDEGAKRAERAAAACFAQVEVRNRSGGWRVVELRQPTPSPTVRSPWLTWEGPSGPMRTLVGTFSADRLDAGTAALLAALEQQGARGEVAGGRVLDLGCGSGVLALWAAQAGAAQVLALDDDLAAVRSCGASASAAQVEARWSDLTHEVVLGAGFDVVLTNPPFHVGRQVVGALSEAFVAAAAQSLRPGGRLWLVANAALPFERLLAGWDALREVTPSGERRYRVFSATCPANRSSNS